MSSLSRAFNRHGLLLVLCLCVYACSVKLVAQYDPASMAQIEQIDSQIERFYLVMQAEPKPKRQYALYAKQYLDIELLISAFKRRQGWRDLNQETLKQAQILAQFWQQDKTAHQAKNTLSNFLIKRRLDQYHRLIDAIARGELAKNNQEK